MATTTAAMVVLVLIINVSVLHRMTTEELHVWSRTIQFLRMWRILEGDQVA